MIRSAFVVAFSLAAGAAAAHPAMTAFETTMRAAPSGHARPVQRIPAHAQIDLGSCSDSWCHASWRDRDGFLRVEAIAANDEPLDGPRPYFDRPYYGGPYYYGGPVIVGPAFGFGYYHHRHW